MVHIIEVNKHQTVYFIEYTEDNVYLALCIQVLKLEIKISFMQFTIAESNSWIPILYLEYLYTLK